MMRMLTALTLGLMIGATTYAEELFEGAPPAPPGYEDHRAAQTAVLTGKVATVDADIDLPENIAFHDDLVYATRDGMELQMDLYVPKNAKTPPPVLMFIHGGGWRAGKKEDYRYYNIKFAERGYATASVQYRLLPDHIFPAAIHDVECGIAWLAGNGADYGYDGSRMVVLGGSAGGHLSLLAGYNQDASLECPDGTEAETTIAGIVNIYGVVDCTTPTAQAAHQVNSFIGKPYDEAKETWELSSPIHHLDKNDPPTLTIHGTIDELVPIRQADMLHEKLDELGIPNYYDRVEGWPHTMDLVKDINDRCRYIIGKFLDKHLPLEK